MNKEIEMFEISDEPPNIGTEIFDKEMPSNIDFEQRQQLAQKPTSQSKPSASPHSLQISEDITSYRIVGKIHKPSNPQLNDKQIVKNYLLTFPVKCLNEQKNGGFMKIWQSIVGYANRQIFVADGCMYSLDRKKQELQVFNIYRLDNLFKVFVDHEQDQIRFVFKNKQHTFNRDFRGESYMDLLKAVNEQLKKMGTSLIQ